MTFSIVARCPRTGQLAVAAVTGAVGVGQLLTWARTGVGAVATQGWINPYLGIDALAMLSNGHPADKALTAVIDLDEEPELRQVGVVDSDDRSAAHTGKRSAPWAGHHSAKGWAVQGNLLENDATLEACARRFVDEADKPLVTRLILALEAGEAVGGDRRGARSATAYVVDTERYPLWDLRVDDADDPIAELHRLRERFAETLLPQIHRLPTRQNCRGRLTEHEQAGLV